MKTTSKIFTVFLLTTALALGLSSSALGTHELVRAFGFGCYDITRATYNEPSVNYTIVLDQDGGNVPLYSEAQAWGYTDTVGVDDSANDRTALDGEDDHIYNSFIGVKLNQAPSRDEVSITFRIDLDNGNYMVVAAGGYASDDHSSTIRARDGDLDPPYILIENAVHLTDEYWSVVFQDKIPPPGDGIGADPIFPPGIQAESPLITITQGYMTIEQDVGPDTDNGADLCILEVWRVKGTSAGPDQTVTAGQTVTLAGSGLGDETSWHWDQIGGTDIFTADLQPNADSQTVQFDTPAVDIGFLLTFELTAVSQSEGPSTDIVEIKVMAPNAPKLAPTISRVMPLDLEVAGQGLGFKVEWDPIFDAEKYQILLKADSTYVVLETIQQTSYLSGGMVEGETRTRAIRGWNQFGASDEPTAIAEVSYTAMPNVALPDTLGGTREPTEYLSSVLPSPIAGLNNTLTDDDMDSSDGDPKDEDHWGYLWSQLLLFDHIVYHTGQLSSNGGWFTSLTVQYTQDGTTWKDATGVAITPAYDFTNSQSGRTPFTRYDISFMTVRGIGIRVFGTPGGSAAEQYTSISELEVFGNQLGGPLFVYGVDATFDERAQAVLDGSNSFSTSGDLTGLQWVQTGEPHVDITGANQLTATFPAPGVDADTPLTFQFTAGDGTDTLTDDVTITVRNLVTTAVAGPDQRVLERSEVTLNGTGSVTTSEIEMLDFSWTQTEGTEVDLTGANTATPSFTAPAIWDNTDKLIFNLTVQDGVGGQSTDSTIVYVNNPIFFAPAEGGDMAGDPWNLKSQDIYPGTPDIAGDATYDPATGTYAVTANGDDIWGTNDQFRFAYLEIPEGIGDFSVSARVDGPPVGESWPDDWTKVGIMFRQDLDPNSADMYLIASWANGIVQQYRPAKGASATRSGGDDGKQNYENDTWNFQGPVWLKLERRGDVFTGYYSFDGIQWLREPPWDGHSQYTVAFEEPFYVGICLTSHTDAATATAIFGDLKFNGQEGHVLTDAYAFRTLPGGYEPGGATDVSLSVKINPDNPPPSVTVTENIPTGLSVVPGSVTHGGTATENTVTWALTGGGATEVGYSVQVPGDASDALNFAGTVSFLVTTVDIYGDNTVYAVPTAPRYVFVEMLQAAHVSWGAPATEGAASYRIERSVDGGPWEEIASGLTGTSFTDKWVEAGKGYSYQVYATSVIGDEGPASPPTAQASVPTMEIRQAEDFNYGAGSYPWNDTVTVEAIEAPDATTIGAPEEYDYYHPSTGGPGTRTYRPLDNRADGSGVGIQTREEGDDPGVFHTCIGWIDVGTWYRFTFDVPEAGWIKLEFRVACPDGGTIAAYWDEDLIGTVSYRTGAYDVFTWAPLEDQVQTTAGEHTLRVQLASGQLDFDVVAIGYNWTPPARVAIFEDNFDSYTANSEVFDPAVGGWTKQTAGYPDGAWQLWNTAVEPDIAGMEDGYMISNSDWSGENAPINEQLISPQIDTSDYTKLRLNFNWNYQNYLIDPDHPQIAEVDISVFDAATGWGDWINLLHLDLDSVSGLDPAILSGTDVHDLSVYDGKTIQLRFHFYDAEWDYWFAVDSIRVSGIQPEIRAGIIGLSLVGDQLTLDWEPDGSYYIEHTTDLTGTWADLPGGPVTGTTAVVTIPAGPEGYYRLRAAQ